MQEIIELKVKDDKVILSEDEKLTFKRYFSGSRVNFLLGAGFSAAILKSLENQEIIFEKVERFLTEDTQKKIKLTIFSAYLYWLYFLRCIYPMTLELKFNNPKFEQYKMFGNILYRIFSERGNPALDRQFNIFTTNYDPIIETIFDRTNCICNDGFEGRISPVFSTDNFTKSYFRQAMFSNRKTEIPSLNLIKLHGSITWNWNEEYEEVGYQDYRKILNDFFQKNQTLFDPKMVSYIEETFKNKNEEEINILINDFIGNSYLDGFIDKEKDFSEFIIEYKDYFFIINPTKEKFKHTLMNKNYYELLRLFSNELEKENTLLIVEGFSFRDEHIMDLVKRSMLNPSLKILIFCYKENNLYEYKELFGKPKNDNIGYIYLKDNDLVIKYLNQILSEIHA